MHKAEAKVEMDKAALRCSHQQSRLRHLHEGRQADMHSYS